MPVNRIQKKETLEYGGTCGVVWSNKKVYNGFFNLLRYIIYIYIYIYIYIIIYNYIYIYIYIYMRMY